jgi:hypothetical protein
MVEVSPGVFRLRDGRVTRAATFQDRHTVHKSR